MYLNCNNLNGIMGTASKTLFNSMSLYPIPLTSIDTRTGPMSPNSTHLLPHTLTGFNSMDVKEAEFGLEFLLRNILLI